MKNLVLLIALLFPVLSHSQHTFSIVAIDSISGEIGSAGATCGDSIRWPGTPGAMLISDILPGLGAIHTQSYHHNTNQSNARSRMEAGDTPQEIMDWLVANDVSSDPEIRQYGVVDYNGGSPRSAAFTGESCLDYKNHILGSNYAIQGNILLGDHILESMEEGFHSVDGCLSDKLMAAMQGANVVGADTRCTSEGTSSLSAFIRMAKPEDETENIFLDINIAATAEGVEPIDQLQIRYAQWKAVHSAECTTVSSNNVSPTHSELRLFPNPSDQIINVKFPKLKFSNIRISNISGKKVYEKSIQDLIPLLQVSTKDWNAGVYILELLKDNKIIAKQKFTVYHY